MTIACIGNVVCYVYMSSVSLQRHPKLVVQTRQGQGMLAKPCHRVAILDTRQPVCVCVCVCLCKVVSYMALLMTVVEGVSTEMV